MNLGREDVDRTVNIAQVQFMSKSLGRHVAYSVILPDASVVGPGPYPVLYQLHGASDDHTAWLNLSNLVRHVSNLPLIVALPDGALSFWINHNQREKYEDFLMDDLWNNLKSNFRVRDGKAAIGGLSMGGYGSLYQGLKHPERFCSIWAHSSACFDEADFRSRGGWCPEDPKAADLFKLAESVDPSNMAKLSFDCGTEDFLIEQNRSFDAHLAKLGIPHSYTEHPGAHTWDYWDIHVREALDQHATALGIKGS